MSRNDPNATPSLLQPSERVLSTLNDDGSRRWLSPRLSNGFWLTRRRWVAYILIAIFTLIPHLTMNGKPLILIDVDHREFTFFGHTFLPTDTLVLALFVLGVLLSIFLVTALVGRTWCGWACPQTVYMEFLYRPLERLFLGTRGKGGPPPRNVPIARRVGLYATYLVISCYLAHTFLAYFVGVEALSQWVRQSPFEHPAPFMVMAIVTVLMMFNFTYFREQTCIIACPYGRLQSVLLDRDSLIVSYDARRGEPRGKIHGPARAKADGPLPLPVVNAESRLQGDHSTRTQGDCIDCRLCVTTCPTGIDIRDGLQLECVGCTQCIDACDAVMDKIGRERGLIRYSSQRAILGEGSRMFRWRVVLYPAILLVVSIAFFVAIARQQTVDVRLLRSAGAPFTILPDGRVANPLKLKLTNRTEHEAHYRVSVGQAPGEIELQIEDDLLVAPRRSESRGLLVIAPPEAFTAGRADLILVIHDQNDRRTEAPCRLLGPVQR